LKPEFVYRIEIDLPKTSAFTKARTKTLNMISAHRLGCILAHYRGEREESTYEGEPTFADYQPPVIRVSRALVGDWEDIPLTDTFHLSKHYDFNFAVADAA
jgi:hypothetical protein